jgi:hypothetical protein
MPRKRRAEEMGLRLRHLIALDAATVMRRLESRREEMFALFSRLRTREPLLSSLSTRFTSATLGELLELSVREQAVVHHFYERLEEMRWYFTYTEDMPGTVQQRFETLQRRLTEAYRGVLAALGPPLAPDGESVVEGEVVHAAPARPRPLRSRRTAPPER